MTLHLFELCKRNYVLAFAKMSYGSDVALSHLGASYDGGLAQQRVAHHFFFQTRCGASCQCLIRLSKFYCTDQLQLEKLNVT